MKSVRGQGNTFSFVQVDQDIDLDYVRGILDETRERTEGPSFMEQRAQIANTGETDMEDELIASVEEITNIEKQLKTLLSVTEYLFENHEELQTKLDTEVAEVETAKRDATTYRLKFDQLEVKLGLTNLIRYILGRVPCLVKQVGKG